MAILGFLKQRKPRQFNLKYRYYDEHKERLKESEARVHKQMGMEAKNDYKVNPDRIRNSMREALEESRQKKRDMVRLGIVIGFILICTYLVIHYVF